jgi:LysM domain
MTDSRQASLPRCSAVAGGAAAGYGALVAWLLPTVLAESAGTFEAALVRLCSGLALAAGGWLWLVTTITVLAALRGHAQRTVGVPAPLRRAVLAACGVALTGSLIAAGPAHATPGRQHEDRAAKSASAIAGLPLPDRATAPPAALARPTVVVAPGDTLWAIAARSLGPGASDADIDAAWRRLYDLNRAEIGPDPDLIRPAQRLEALP